MEQKEIETQEAVVACEKWLTLIEFDDFADSWEETSKMFRSAVTVEDWKANMESLREAMGKTLTRTIHSKTYLTELPGAPDGEYVVIEYHTTFENKKSAVETITPMKEADGVWRVSGYYIK
jgi:hypothetical protein